MRRNFLWIILILLFISIAACDGIEQEDKESELDEVEEEEGKVFEQDLDIVQDHHPDTGQGYTIIHTFDLYESFFSKVNTDMTDGELDALFQEEIIDVVYEPCFENGEHIHMTDLFLDDLSKDPSEIMEIIDNTEMDELNDAIFESLVESSNYLDTNEETVVCILPNTDENFPLGVNVGTGKIIILYNPEFTDEMVKTVIAHEYHHSIWTERHFAQVESTTVLDNLIFEGKAVMFEKTVYPGNTIFPTNPPNIKKFWEMIEPDLHKEDFERSSEILHGAGNLPRAYGYLEGYKMVKSYVEKHPDLTPEDWLETEAQIIFDEGNYVENYE